MKALHHSARVALVGILGLALALAGPLGANAASGIPDPVNVLPSVVKGGATFGPGSLAFQTYMAKFLGQFAVTAKQQAAIAAATPTPAQLETITGLKAGFKMPGFKMGSLVKGAGAVGIALLVKDLAGGVGQSTLEALGIDVEGNVGGAGGPSPALDATGGAGTILPDGSIAEAASYNYAARVEQMLTVALNQRPNDGVPVEVVNGTGDPAFGLVAADRLIELGLRVVSVTSTSRRYTHTVLMDYTTSKKGSLVPLLQRTLKIQVKNVIAQPKSTGPRYRIVVGDDFNSCYYQ